MRQSNLELLRIIAMMAVVIGHLATQGRLLHYMSGWQAAAAPFLSLGARISVNVFALIGCWFMAGSGFRPERWIRLHSATWFYAVPLSLAMLHLWPDVPRGDVVRAFFPFLGRPLWFVSSWLFVMLAAPFLQRLAESEARGLGAALAVFGAFFCVQSTVADVGSGFIPDTLWMLYMFALTAYVKRRMRLDRLGMRVTAPLFALSIAVYGGLVIAYSHGSGAVPRLAMRLLFDLKSIPNFFCSATAFLFFLNLDLGENRAVNAVARSSFAVYVVHQTPAFYRYLWFSVFRLDEWKRTDMALPLLIALPAALYAAVSVADALRRAFVEPAVLRSRPARFAERLLNRLHSIP